MPGHKGLLGPQGTGLLILPRGDMPIPLLQGGTGSASFSLEQPAFLPDRLESGTPNVPGISGLAAGIRFLLEADVAKIYLREQHLMSEFSAMLRTVPSLEVFAAENPVCQSGLVSVRIPGESSELLAQALAARDICVRGGLHCAPLAHRSAQTDTTGTVRFSLSPYTTADELTQTVQVLREILCEM